MVGGEVPAGRSSKRGDPQNHLGPGRSSVALDRPTRVPEILDETFSCKKFQIPDFRFQDTEYVNFQMRSKLCDTYTSCMSGSHNLLPVAGPVKWYMCVPQ